MARIFVLLAMLAGVSAIAGVASAERAMAQATVTPVAASAQDLQGDSLDPVPAPIETSPLPEVVPGADPSIDPAAPEQAVQQPQPVVPTIVALPEPATPLARELLASLKPVALPKRKRDKAEQVEVNRKRQIWRFYAERGGEPVWLKDGAFSEAALQVVAEIAKAKDWGLNPAHFDVPVSVPATAAIGSQIDVELKFTNAVLAYAQEARTGQFDPVKISDLVDRMSAMPAPYATLKAISESSDTAKALVSFHPQHPQFEKLREAYLALRDGAEPADQVTIPEGPKLKPGSSHPHIALLRKRLGVAVPEGVKEEDGPAAEFYDPVLVTAVKAAQTERDMRSDGVFGRSLRDSLNGDKAEPKDRQIRRILANLERWRWLPTELGDTYILNNIPDFVTKLVKDNQVIFQERIVVGKPTTPTALFSDHMEYIDFNPRWNVPLSIKINELWPSIQRNGGGSALNRQGLKVLQNGRERDPEDVNWSTTDIRNVDIFQPSGPGNALGRVKFMFPNSHDIYMHDTPSKALFNESVRTFSHGCMRVRNPQSFAEAILGVANGMGPDEVKANFDTSENHQVQLGKKIPVHVTYFTAWVADDGTISTRRDVYGQDERTTLALAGRFDDIDRQTVPKPDFQSAAVSRQRVAESNPNNNQSLFSIFDLFTNGNE